MKLSENTLNVLKSFAVINTGIEFKPGNVLQTISPQKSILAKAEIEDDIPAHGCFYELNRFLGVLSLFDNPQLDFQEKYVTIRDIKRSVNYTFADPQMIVTPPAKEVQLPSVDVEVDIKWADISNALRAVFKLENIKMMNFDYKVELSSKGIAKFTSLNNKTWKDEKVEFKNGPVLSYWIATETQQSTFE